MRRRRCSRLRCAAARRCLRSPPPRPRRWPRPQPYGTNDAGGFRNVLPPGENGLDTTSARSSPSAARACCRRTSPTSSRSTKTSSTRSPTLTEDQIPNYFKDATFGVPAGEVESTIEPRPGVTIVRDKAFGVPHVYGDTRADTMFGAGYAGAARPPLPDGRAAPHRPRRTRLLPRRLQRRRRRQPVGLRPLHRSRPRKAAGAGAAASTARAGSRRSTTSAPTSKGSTPTSPPPASTRS